MIELFVTHPIATVAIALAAVTLTLAVRALALGYPRPRLQNALLTRRQQAVVAACADTFFPPGGAIPVSGTEAGLVEYMDTYVRRLDARGRFLVGLLLTFIELGPFVFGPRPCRFSRLSLAHRLAMLDGMAKSDIYFRRVAFLSMRTMLTMGYLSNPRVAAAMQMRIDPAPFEHAASPAPVSARTAPAGSASTTSPVMVPA